MVGYRTMPILHIFHEITNFHYIHGELWKITTLHR